MTKSQSPLVCWIDEVFGRPTPSVRLTSAFDLVPTSAEQRSDRTAYVARQIIEDEKKQRQADGARLRQARLEREAQGRASQGSSASESPQLGQAD